MNIQCTVQQESFLSPFFPSVRHGLPPLKYYIKGGKLPVKLGKISCPKWAKYWVGRFHVIRCSS